MAVGNTAALLQRDVKRLLAYSSVAQAGYILVGLVAGTPDAYGAVLFYAAAYVVMNLGAFLVAVRVGEGHRVDNPGLQHFNGLAERSPLLALLLLVSLLSLGGIPPLFGFTGKWFLFAAAMKKGHWFLVLSAVINSVVSLYYYLTVVKHAYLLRAETQEPLRTGPALKMVALALFAALLVFGVFPRPLIEAAEAAFR
jgi:NADH-quinone oxidoreductase subunit N